MTRDEMVELFERFDGDFLKPDSNGPKRPDLAAFNRLAELVPDGKGDIVTSAEHDQIYLDVDMEKLAAVVTEDDVRFLVRCGVFIDEDGLSMFA